MVYRFIICICINCVPFDRYILTYYYKFKYKNTLLCLPSPYTVILQSDLFYISIYNELSQSDELCNQNVILNF